MILETPENPNLNNSLIRFSDRGFGLFVYALFTVCGAAILWQGRSAGLFPAPLPGTDQLSMIEAAFGLASGEPLPAGYLYSPAYTGFLAAAKLLTGGNLVAMRMVQCLVAGWIPVMIPCTRKLFSQRFRERKARITRKYDGTRSPIVATNAPGMPPRRNPKKVAAFTPIGPGVIWEIAVRSPNSCRVIQCCSLTRWSI